MKKGRVPRAEPDLLKRKARAWLSEHTEAILAEGKRLMLEGTKDDEIRFKAWKTLVDKFLPDLKEKVDQVANHRPIAIQINNVQRGRPELVRRPIVVTNEVPQIEQDVG